MTALPDTVSFLKSEGHLYAEHYPIWRLWAEAKIARARINRMLGSQAIVQYKASATAFSGSRKANKAFTEFIKELFDGEPDGR